MGTTSNLSLPFPDPSDPNDVPADMQALADALDPIIIPDTTFSAKGDILVATGSATPSAVTVGVDGTVLKADSAEASGVTWGQIENADIATDAVNADSIIAGAVGNVEIRDGSATSVIGRSAGTGGDVADIVASQDFEILSRASGTLGFNIINSAYVSDFDEAAQDAVGTALNAGTHSGITVAYNDNANTISVSHADTSSASSINNSGATVIQDVTVDTYGHVTAMGSKTLNAGDVGALSTTADSSTAYTVTIGGTSKYLRIKDTVNASHYVQFATADLTANRTITFPNASGTVSLDGHGHSYASTSHTHSYLPTSGGTLSGNLVFSGNSYIQFEGSSADSYETRLYASNPTGSDKNIYLPNAGGTLSLDGHTHSYASVGHTHSYAPTSHTHSYVAVTNGQHNGTLTMYGPNTLGVGNITMGTPTSGGNGQLRIATTNASNTNITLDTQHGGLGGAYYVLSIYHNGANKGSISHNGSTTSFNTTSDYRIKENIAELSDGLEVVNSLKPRRFTFKDNATDTRVHTGFIAHELQAVMPELVIGEKDAVDENGEMLPQVVDKQGIVAVLVSAVQKLSEEVDALKAQLA